MCMGTAGRYINLAAPTIKQQLAAIRHLFDWLVVGQIIPINPAGSVRGPTHIVWAGKTPVLEPASSSAASKYRHPWALRETGH